MFLATVADGIATFDYFMFTCMADVMADDWDSHLPNSQRGG